MLRLLSRVAALPLVSRVAALRLLSRVAALSVVCALAGCSPGDQPSRPSSSDDGTATTGSRGEDVVRYVSPETYGQAMVECLSEQGFPVGLTVDGRGVSFLDIPSSQQEAVLSATQGCELRYTLDPIYEAPLTDAQKGFLYDWNVAAVPCLQALGYTDLGPIPSRETYLSTYLTDQMWSPFLLADNQSLAGNGISFERALESCPEQPPQDQLYAEDLRGG